MKARDGYLMTFLCGNHQGYHRVVAIELEPTKNRTPARVLGAGKPAAPSKGNPWNYDLLGYTTTT